LLRMTLNYRIPAVPVALDSIVAVLILSTVLDR